MPTGAVVPASIEESMPMTPTCPAVERCKAGHHGVAGDLPGAQLGERQGADLKPRAFIDQKLDSFAYGKPD
jgi:hypothetical protein